MENHRNSQYLLTVSIKEFTSKHVTHLLENELGTLPAACVIPKLKHLLYPVAAAAGYVFETPRIAILHFKQSSCGGSEKQ